MVKNKGWDLPPNSFFPYHSYSKVTSCVELKSQVWRLLIYMMHIQTFKFEIIVSKVQMKNLLYLVLFTFNWMNSYFLQKQSFCIHNSVLPLLRHCYPKATLTNEKKKKWGVEGEIKRKGNSQRKNTDHISKVGDIMLGLTCWKSDSPFIYLQKPTSEYIVFYNQPQDLKLNISKFETITLKLVTTFPLIFYI